MNRPADFVFDLDGTVSDPLVGIHRCVNFALSSIGVETVADSTVARLIGPPLDEAFRSLVPDCSASDIARLVEKYRERYAQAGFGENTLYDGVLAALTSMSERGLRVGVCTSKREDFAEKILSRFGIRALFGFVDGGDVGVAKAQQLEQLRRSGKVDHNSTMIGDRAIDMSAARANGLSRIGVLWGYGSQAELEEAGAESILLEPSELFGIDTRGA